MLEGRMQRYVEQLYEDSSLTGDVDDRPAMALLEWGANLTRQAVATTAAMDDEMADEALYPTLKAIRKVVRGTSRLLGGMPEMESDEIQEKLEKIFDSAGKIPGVEVTGNASGLAQRLANLPPSDGVHVVLGALSTPEGDGSA
ncbi:MAG: hypothetical protein GYB68_05445 [Chloroflexi bacterium]|nr:hypothetical protein [Chloroflexota bacterium]